MFNVFPYVFTNVFNTLVNNTELIDNIVDKVLNSDLMDELINSFDSIINVSIELKEYKKAYIIEANLPGVLKEDISVDYNNNYVTIEIKRNQIYNNGKNIAIAIVGQDNNVAKDFYVEGVNYRNIRAVFKNEILQVLLPKRDNDITVVEVEEFISD